MVRSGGRRVRRQIRPRIVTAWTATVLSLWAALFAQVVHLRVLDDGVGALAFGWLARGLLAAGTGFFVTTIGV